MHSPSAIHNAHPVYRPDIDGLRAVAILSVVAFHAFPNVLHGGFVGVDIFFVISGFLISSIIFKSLQRGDFSFAEFYAHRVQRIFPALILVMFACFVVGWFVLLPDEFRQLGKHLVAGVGFVQNFVLWSEAGYFDTSSEVKPLMHLWSLAIEEQFYIVYPVLVVGAWRLGLNVLVIVTLLGVWSFGLNVGGVEQDAVKTFFLPQSRFWELLTGAVLAYMQLFQPASSVAWLIRVRFSPWAFSLPALSASREAAIRNVMSGFGLTWIFLSVLFLHQGNLYPGWWALFPVLGACLLVWAGPQAKANRTFLSNRLMVWVGLISYPLYLWHWPMLAFARIMESETPSITTRLAAVVLSFVFAWLTYRLLEQPIRWAKKTWVKTTTLCALLGAVGVAGYVAFDQQGLAFRIPPEIIERNAEFVWAADGFHNEGCEKSFPLFAKAEFCKQSKLGQPSILLVGDSHANHLYPGLSGADGLAGENILNIGGAGCQPFLNVASFQKGSEDTCADLMNSALQFAENTASVQAIVMVSRGPLAISGKGFGSTADEKYHDRVLALVNQPETTGFREIFTMAMRATLERLTATHKQVIFVLDVAELGFDPKTCSDTRPMRLGGGNRKEKNACAVSRQVFDERSREYKDSALSVLKDFPNVKVFDAAAELCDAQWCWAMKNGHMLYRDSNHLSIKGSEYIARVLSKVIHPVRE